MGKVIPKLGNESIVKCSHEMFGFLDDFYMKILKIVEFLKIVESKSIIKTYKYK